MRERIGIFGGTFDPPHVGHLSVAEWAREELRLDRVLFVPAGQPPHKRGRKISAARDRVAMTRLAIRGHDAFQVSLIETRRRGPSFTVETLRTLRRRWPHARFFLIVGADNLEEFGTWREPESIAALATVALAARPPARRGTRGRSHAGRSAASRAAKRPRSLRIVELGNPALEVSSSGLRALARAGRSPRYLVPDRVARYITQHRLYRGRR